MAAYMKTTQPFFGVTNTPRREIMREAWKRFTPGDAKEWRAGVEGLFEAGMGGSGAEPSENPVASRRDSVMRPPVWGGEREFFYMACEFAERGGRSGFHTASALPLFKRMIERSGWWDIVDWTASKLVGGAFVAEPEKVGSVMERWVGDTDLWVRRAAVICQIWRKERTDTEMLGRFCLMRAHEKDFFMRKAIGWALRHHARTDPEWVRRFLVEHDERLSSLSVREAAKHL